MFKRSEEINIKVTINGSHIPQQLTEIEMLYFVFWLDSFQLMVIKGGFHMPVQQFILSQKKCQ